MKYLKSFLESADSPELVGKFSPDELKTAATNDDPYDTSKSMMKFQNGLYMGKAGEASAKLQHDMHQSQYGEPDSRYAISDYLYKHLIEKIPDFKNGYELKEDDDKEAGKLGIWLRKEQRIKGTQYKSLCEIWLHYHTKYNKIHNYEKGKIKLHFHCGIETFDQQFLKNRIDVPEDKIFYDTMVDLLSNNHHKKYESSLTILGRNYTKATFLKMLPVVGKALRYFEFAVSQATFEYQEYLYLNDFLRFFELIMQKDEKDEYDGTWKGDDISYDYIHPKILKLYKDQIPQKIKISRSTSRFDL